ncbi:Nuclear pore complex protein Nup93 [Fasciola hepatica]|uniref:Nuclear pore protein n=1 Tax=Fasciola hepatica TaxID=6192 RepID=A0A4E0R447_FASHE|nr:Nuclear pore complex protein Nup93 [Fasciola hepatica]
MNINLEDLVQDSEKLLMDVQGYSDLPYITRSLDQIKNFGDKLSVSRGSRSDVKAARLLGSKMSYELPSHLSTVLESLSASDLFEVVPSSPKVDIQTFLKTERENVLLNVLALSQDSVFREIEAKCTRTLQSWWTQEASGILSALAGSSAPIDTDLLYSSVVDKETPRQTSKFSEGGSDRTRDELCYSQQVSYALLTFYNSFLLLTLFIAISVFSSRACLHRYDEKLSQYLESCFMGPFPFGTYARNDKRDSLLTYFAKLNGTDNQDLSGPVTKMRPPVHSDLTEIWSLFYRFGDCCQQQGITHESAGNRSLELRASESLQHQFILCSLAHLESEFARFLNVTVSNHARLAKLGGLPGTRAVVRAYLNICLPSVNDSSSINSSALQFPDESGVEFEDGLVDSVPVWPMIYYCLRASDGAAAVEVARSASGSLEDFVGILDEFVSSRRRLSAASWRKLRQNAVQVVKSSHDPFKKVVYSILGVNNLNDSHSELARNIDDFLWIKLSQVASQSSGITDSNKLDESFNLGQLQNLLCETYGEVHFDAWSQPLVYFKLLCLTQQFESAIAFLARFESLRSHAVHIALGLQDLHLLLLSDSLKTPLGGHCRSWKVFVHPLTIQYNFFPLTSTCSTNSSLYLTLFCTKFLRNQVTRVDSDPLGMRRLNLARLIALYTRKFETSFPDEALMYFHFLSDIPTDATASADSDTSTNSPVKGPTNGNLFVHFVAELALATRAFDILLGSLNEGSFIKPGAIARYCRSAEELQEIIGSVANVVESRGQLLDAVSLYQLAANCGPRTQFYYQTAVGIMNYFLTGLVAPDSSGTLSQTFTRAIGRPDREDVLRMATQWQAAVDHIDQLSLFPSNAKPAHIEARVNLFTQLPDCIRRPLPTALLALMRCLVAIATKHMHGSGSSDNIESGADLTLTTIRNRAKALITYVGRIPFRLPGDVYAQLTQMHMELV